VVWTAEGRNSKVLEDFYDELGDAGCAALQAISLDLGGAYQKATNAKAPHVRQCADPFHVIKVRHEVSCLRMEVRDLHRLVVAAAGLKLRAA